MALEVEVTLKNASARAVIWEIYKMCGVYRANNGTEPYSIGLNEGQRRIGLFIENLLSVVPTETLAKWKDDMALEDARKEHIMVEEAQTYNHLDIKERDDE